MRRDGYLPIADYGAIGNLRTVALVGRNGSIDWCCLPALDRPSVFGALLDRRRGGHFRVAPARYAHSEQRYHGHTCVLETHFQAEHGRLMVTDFMPLRGSIIGACDPDTEPSVYRIVRCLGGEVEVEVEWAPRFDYARARTRIERIRGGLLASAGRERLVLGGIPADAAEIVDAGDGPMVRARFHIHAGERRGLVTRYAADDVAHAPREAHAGVMLGDAVALLRDTSDTWVAWAHDNETRPTEHWAGSGATS
jgi:GH15 family glucan-1,4-alpha-glucosidase